MKWKHTSLCSCWTDPCLTNSPTPPLLLCYPFLSLFHSRVQLYDTRYGPPTQYTQTQSPEKERNVRCSIPLFEEMCRFKYGAKSLNARSEY